MTSAYDKLKVFFAENRGRTITGKELEAVAGINSYPRRIRELRQDGWPILTNNDVDYLKPGEYRMDGEPPSKPYRFSKNISRRVRSEVLERNHHACRKCGAMAGEPDPDNPSRVIRLHIDHIKARSHEGDDSPDNLRVLCSACNEGSKNLMLEPPSYSWLLGQVRRATGKDQKAVFDWLKTRFSES